MASPTDYDVRQVVDAMLAAPKTLAGVADWRTHYGETKARWRKPCLFQGEVTQFEVEVQAYPLSEDLKFRIILIFGKVIWRLDFCNTDGHVNSLNRPTELPPGPIHDPHYHAWVDNRRFATKVSLPSELDNANILPANVRSFESAFRWFCGETNIVVPTLEMPQLPPRARLI